MKKSLAVIAGLALMGATVQSYAAVSAVVAADNYGSGAGTISVQGAGLAPATTFVEVLAGPTGGALTVIASGTLAEAGYFDLSPAVIPGVAGGGSADFQVQAWQGGATFATATVAGTSAKWTQGSLGSFDDSVSPPPVKTGPELNMPAFAISTVGPAVPEPSTIALGMLGAAALLIRRRK
jgi:hypothetical protein